MTGITADPGSFRDPGGRVFIDGDRVLRAVYRRNAPDYEASRDAGLLDHFIGKNWLVGCRELEPRSHPAGDGAAYLLEHPKLPFISYPYEWPFALHRKAALLQLDLLLEALERNFALSDATAFNVQFVATTPTFIDHLSFRPYADGAIWEGHRQFCMQFLNPVVMWSKLGVAPNHWFRGSLEGIAPEDLAKLLRWRDNLSWTILSHVTAQGAAQRRSQAATQGLGSSPRPNLPRTSFKAMLFALRSFIEKAEMQGGRTVWDRYDVDNSYGSDEAAAKRRFVQRMVAAVQPTSLFDLGCNTGDYSASAIEAGAGYVVGFDFDFGALERAIRRSESSNLPFLPLWIDATNPSPAQGWAQRERRGFDERAKGDAVIALAFIHHLAIARNVPLEAAVEWIMARAPVGIIEFPPKADPMVQRLLSHRQDIFSTYDEENFLAAVGSQARIVEAEHVSAGGRLLVWYERTTQALLSR